MVTSRLKELLFWSTSFIRGTTLANVIIDEFQNLNYHELDSIITKLEKTPRLSSG